MPIFEYKCESCRTLVEKIFSSLEKSDSEIVCARCGQISSRCSIPSSISLSRSSMDNSPIDNVIGKDSDKRWEDIHNRQEKRDKTREETGSVGLSETSRGNFEPISESNKKTRDEVAKSMATVPKIEPGKKATKSWLNSVD